jgi:amidase
MAFVVSFVIGVLVRQCIAISNRMSPGALAESQVLHDPFPYYFPQQNASAAELFAMPKCHGIDIEDASIDDLQAHMASGRLTSVQLVTCYTQRSFQTAEYIK